MSNYNTLRRDFYDISYIFLQIYTVRLESSLSKATYEITQPEIDITANISYKHITFKFEPKVRTLPGLKVINLFSCSTQLSIGCILLTKVEMPTIVCI